jgi:phosphatidylserine/phosphatidylglycerophosphate/cardiolipin synthase-like enzyme
MSTFLDYTITVPSNSQWTHSGATSQTQIQSQSPPFFASSPLAGFGEYEEFSTEDFKDYQAAQKSHALVVAALIGTTGAGVIVATLFFPVLVWVAPIGIVALAVVGVRTYLKYNASQNHFPPTLTAGLSPQDFQAKRVGELIHERGSAVALSDSTETKKCRMDLIRNAQSSIFLSCYMGEEAFDEALDLIKERMEQNRGLKVFIFGSDHFLTSENRRRIDHLKTTYADRFSALLNQEIYHSHHPKVGSQFLSTNHIKLTVIDQGAYSIIGGSALRPFWTDVTGTEHLTKARMTFDFLLNPLEAKGFRDMDFAFKSAPGGAGTTAFLEGAKLMVRYAHLQDPELAQKLKAQFLEVMRSPAPTTQVPTLDSRPDRAHDVDMKLYSTGPDHTQNSYLHALIDLVNNAREKVVIAHMYFHPPQQLIDALSHAAKRGVKIEIITNSKNRENPIAHRFFVDLAQDKYRQLFEREGHHNVKVHEFYRANTTYHKKVVVVDDRYTGFGSSNLGTKSLEENPADYELNAIADSRSFAAATMRVLQKDMELSDEVPAEKAKNLSWDTRLLARFQEYVMTNIL